MNSKILIASLSVIAVLGLASMMGGNDTGLSPETQQFLVESEKAEKEAAQWAYNDQIDEMRGTTAHVASIRSGDMGSAAPELFIVRNDKGQKGIGIKSSLQSTTAPIMQCAAGFLYMKFDDGPLRKVSCEMGMAVKIDPVVIPDLEKSKVTWIEIETSYGGTNQFKFNTAGLKI